jgi:hypothetical protein
MNRLARVAALVGMLGVIGAIAAPGMQAAVPEKKGDCPLVSTAVAGHTIGKPLKLASPPLKIGTPSIGQSVTCTWDSPTLHQTNVLSARLSKGPNEKANYAKDRSQSLEPVAVSGLGKRAFWTDTGGRVTVLVDAKTLVTIVHPDPKSSGDPSYRAQAEALAKLVIAHL